MAQTSPILINSDLAQGELKRRDLFVVLTVNGAASAAGVSIVSDHPGIVGVWNNGTTDLPVLSDPAINFASDLQSGADSTFGIVVYDGDAVNFRFIGANGGGVGPNTSIGGATAPSHITGVAVPGGMSSCITPSGNLALTITTDLHFDASGSAVFAFWIQYFVS